LQPVDMLPGLSKYTKNAFAAESRAGPQTYFWCIESQGDVSAGCKCRCPLWAELIALPQIP